MTSIGRRGPRPTQAGQEQRVQEMERSAAWRLDNARADVHHPHSGVSCCLGCSFPICYHLCEETLTLRGALAQDFVSSVGTVITDGGGAHEHPRAINDFGGQPGQLARRPDPALVYLAFMAGSKPAGDRYSCEVDDGVGPRQDLRVGVFRVPGSFVGRRGHGAPAG